MSIPCNGCHKCWPEYTWNNKNNKNYGHRYGYLCGDCLKKVNAENIKRQGKLFK